jgi:hypothetical protein
MKTTYKTIELSQEELYAIEGGSEISSAIWKFITYCCTLNSRQEADKDQYLYNFYNH